MLYDFSIMFPEAKANALIDTWQSFEKKPFELHKIEINDADLIFNCDLQLHNFLTFLKMLPLHKVKFKAAVDSFIVVSNVICETIFNMIKII